MRTTWRACADRKRSPKNLLLWQAEFGKDLVGSPALRATFDPANFVQCGIRPFSEAYALIRPHLVYLQVKDALAATSEVVPPGQGDGELRETLAALRDSGFAGFMSLEPHLAEAGRKATG